MVASLLGFSRRLRVIRRRASAHRLRQSKKTSAKKSRVLKKSSSIPAHASLRVLSLRLFVKCAGARRLKKSVCSRLEYSYGHADRILDLLDSKPKFRCGESWSRKGN
jgi:hypothetical protein